MKTFRQKFTKSDYFYTLIVLYGSLVIFGGPTIFVLSNRQNNTVSMCFVVLLMILLLCFISIRALFASRYITISNTELTFINPYMHSHREILLCDITRVKIEMARCVFLHIWDKQGKHDITEITLVPRKDLKEIVGIFGEHGIEVEKDIWKGYIK